MAAEDSPLMNSSDIEVGIKHPATQFKQHDDDDVVIPDHISFNLVVSAQLLLINGILAIVYGLYIMGFLLAVVWLTSILHWYRPRFSSPRRIIDYVAVAAVIGYGTYLSTTLALAYMLVWLVGLAVIAVIFVCNESAFYLQVGKTPLGDSSSDTSSVILGVSLDYTTPNTMEREWVYRRTAYIHLFCVHVLANALALAIIIGTQSSL